MQENLSLIPGLRWSPGKGNGYPLQYSCLENSMDRGAWWATVHGVTVKHNWATFTHSWFTVLLVSAVQQSNSVIHIYTFKKNIYIYFIEAWLTPVFQVHSNIYVWVYICTYVYVHMLIYMYIFSYTFLHILFFRLFSIVGYHKIWTLVPCAMQSTFLACFVFIFF